MNNESSFQPRGAAQLLDAVMLFLINISWFPAEGGVLLLCVPAPRSVTRAHAEQASRSHIRVLLKRCQGSLSEHGWLAESSCSVLAASLTRQKNIHKKLSRKVSCNSKVSGMHVFLPHVSGRRALRQHCAGLPRLFPGRRRRQPPGGQREPVHCETLRAPGSTYALNAAMSPLRVGVRAGGSRPLRRVFSPIVAE